MHDADQVRARLAATEERLSAVEKQIGELRETVKKLSARPAEVKQSTEAKQAESGKA